MKGVELPINLIIIIALALIVLLSVVSLYFSGWLPGALTINVDSVKTESCKRLMPQCYNDVSLVTIDNFDADKDGILDPDIGVGDCSEPGGPSNDNLYMLCQCYYNANEDECRDICMCKGLASSPLMPPGP